VGGMRNVQKGVRVRCNGVKQSMVHRGKARFCRCDGTSCDVGLRRLVEQRLCRELSVHRRKSDDLSSWFIHYTVQGLDACIPSPPPVGI
jgi:hypothetical protein